MLNLHYQVLPRFCLASTLANSPVSLPIENLFKVFHFRNCRCRASLFYWRIFQSLRPSDPQNRGLSWPPASAPLFRLRNTSDTTRQARLPSRLLHRDFGCGSKSRISKPGVVFNLCNREPEPSTSWSQPDSRSRASRSCTPSVSSHTRVARGKKLLLLSGPRSVTEPAQSNVQHRPDPD